MAATVSRTRRGQVRSRRAQFYPAISPRAAVQAMPLHTTRMPAITRTLATRSPLDILAVITVPVADIRLSQFRTTDRQIRGPRRTVVERDRDRSRTAAQPSR